MASRGELEQRILEDLWQHRQPQTVAEVHKRLKRERELAYTTVMTVLDRLAKKGLVKREMKQRAWEYQPAFSQPELIADDLLRAFHQAPLELRGEVLQTVFQKLADEEKIAWFEVVEK